MNREEIDKHNKKFARDANLALLVLIGFPLVLWLLSA